MNFLYRLLFLAKVFVTLQVILLPSFVSAGQAGLSVRDDGILVKDGSPYRGVGVNYYDAFLRTLINPGDTSYKEGIKKLSDLGIPFARVSISGFWPMEFNIYKYDKAKYFRFLDDFVKTAEQHRVGLILCFFWNYSTVPDLVGESVNQWGNPQSKTHAFMKDYVREVVARYKDSPAILAWEYGNELNLQTRFGNRPLVNSGKGTPPVRKKEDEITPVTMMTALSEFGKSVREIDNYRAIISGNAIPRPEELDQHEKWSTAAKGVYTSLLRDGNPDPINTISIHYYSSFESRYLTRKKLGAGELMKVTMEAASSLNKPLLLLEFGASRDDSPWTVGAQQEKTKFFQYLDIIETTGIPLSAVWVYDFSEQAGTWNITVHNDRGYQLRAISDLNKRMSQIKK